ncbi:S9 family peptidase [Sphingobacterium paludis]|uniref:Dipeptidyl aminopeptidase/acylaminoacyl peptidase n=1 Tax=Sphingobacterium paludis TaxID=1476465 RepID=A0A4R7DBU9_9SPHI|nr:prolyl oligopeptidase family serine peptidase [Sphingobacterium paludis]TDS17384.1 dipeptidyl aminopeptidase/acylaminoacyl peptidase [Sphingobacterium paludis]
MHIKIASLGASLLLTGALFAQKRPLDHSVYDNWKSISNTAISKSGQFISYQIMPQEGDGLFQLKKPDNALLLSIPRGASAQLTKDETFLIAAIKSTFQETRQAKIKKKKADDMPKDSLLIVNLQNKQEWKFPQVKSFKLAQNKNEYLAFLTEEKNQTKAPADTATSAKKSNDKSKNATVLYLQNLSTGDTVKFWKADQYALSPNEDYLLFSKKNEAKDSTATDAGLYLYDIVNKQVKKISNGRGTYKELSFDDKGMQVAFLADKSPEKSLLKDYKLYYYTTKLDSAHIIASQQSTGIPQQWYVSGDASLNFSADGQKLYFGLAPIPRVKDTTLVDFEHAQLDVWHWKDDYLQPQQLVNLKRDLSKSYAAVVYPTKGNRIIALLDDTFSRTSMTDDANNEWILTSTDFGKRVEGQWQGSTKSDVYIVSTQTGQKKLVKKDLNGYPYLSPNGDYVLYFDREQGNWHSYNIKSGSDALLNDGMPVSFVDEENDSPTLPGAYGIAGWSTDNRSVYLYDRYDIWRFDLSGKSKQLITNGEGRASKKSFRYIDLDRQENPRYRTTRIPDNKRIYLSALDEATKQNGVFEAHSSKSRRPSEIVLAGFVYRGFKASENEDTFIYTKENYSQSPNLYVSKAFKNEQRLTDVNPQQQSYNWGTAELVKWTTPGGKEAEGILYKPENFDPNKKYPIIAYFYEKLTDGLYNYQAPAPTPSRLNIPYYVSNEYLVFAPDIRYEIGHPGKSAEEYVNSGMRHLAKNSWVDSTKMAIQGQSWGGYQVAHLITRTPMYAAAWTGAPVVNMTSAYGGIRWQSGMSRQFQYEHTQSRIGKTLWEDQDLYLENSPLFYLDQVSTPVVIMHNDNDGAVPWYQGIEMFTALRRLQKPVWMLNYNGDEHNLIKRQNRKDIQIRQAQFFDHFLKGKPATKWITSGVPAVEKGIDWGLE